MRSVSLAVGLFLFALGIVLPARVRARPLAVGRAQPGHLRAHVAVVRHREHRHRARASSSLAWALGARIGPGTVANAVFIGLFVDGLLAIDAVDSLSDSPLAVRIVLMLAGVLIIGIGSGFYIGAGMGAGPRDSLMLVVARRAGVRIGVSRVAIEVLVTVIGFAFGGTVGIGTLVFAFGIGPAVELSFWLLERSPLADPAPNLSHAA